MAKSAKIGDICELSIPGGFGYIQFTHETEEMGELVRILPGLFQERPVEFVSLSQQKELYFIFYPLKAALRAKQTIVVANLPILESARTLPTMRHPGMEDETGKPAYWLLFPAGTSLTLEFLRSAKRITTLSPEQEKLSIDFMASHPSLIHKISSGWTPVQAEKRRKAALARKEVRGVEDSSSVQK